MSRPPRDNTEAEIEAFATVCERLGGFDDRLAPEWIDGYLTALATSPRRIALDEWLPVMAGDAYERAFADPDDQHAARAALLARERVLVEQLDAGAIDEAPDLLRLSPLMATWDAEARAQLVGDGVMDADEAGELVTGGLWADGFFAAMRDFMSQAPPGAGDEELELYAQLLQHVHVLRLAETDAELAEHIASAYPKQGADRDVLVDEACFAVQDLRMWWVDHAPRPETRRVEKTPGRNDPCPCGSGRKYKKCHGAG